MIERPSGDLELEAYVMPNQVIDNEVPLSSFQVELCHCDHCVRVGHFGHSMVTDGTDICQLFTLHAKNTCYCRILNLLYNQIKRS